MSRWIVSTIGCMLICASVSGLMGQNRCDFDQRIGAGNEQTLHQMEEQIKGGQTLFTREEIHIPVVFHIVYFEPEENISDLQIRTQVDILNRDFAFMSDNVSGIPEEFRDLGVDAGIRFCLAVVDPDGNPTSGITRTETDEEFIGSHREGNTRYSVHYDIYDGKNGWDPSRYINIWVANLDGLLGSASFPGMAPFPEEDGIVIDPEFVGGIGLATRPFHRGHTLTHEMGHYLGLYHIWGTGNGGCNVDDLVEDTPEQESAYTGCPDYPQHSCGTSNMFMNFMDFTDDHCLALFTQGQVERMQSALMGVRSALLQNSDACAPPDTVKVPIEEALIFYAFGSQQVILFLDGDAIMERSVRLYASDGRLIADEVWNAGSVFWIDAERFIPGLYVVELEEEEERVFTKIVIN